MAMNVSEFVWHRLHEWGIEAGLWLSRRWRRRPRRRAGEGQRTFMQYVQVRHEEMAAFMASAHAKFTGEVGLCYATSGPGAIHLLNGLYDAKMDHVPVVAIVGQQARTAIGGASISRKSTCSRYSRTWRRISSPWPACPPRCAT